MSTTININVKVMADSRCFALNYNRRPHAWEAGTVRSVRAGISKDGSYHVSYQVLLDRRTTGRSRMFPEGGAPIFITVGDDSIEPEK